MKHLRKFLLFILLLLISSSVYFLLRGKTWENDEKENIVKETPVSYSADQSVPDAAVKNFRRTIMKEGRKEWEISSETAYLFRHDDKRDSRVHLKDISQIQFFDLKGRIYEITADSGIWDQKEGYLRLEENIRGTMSLGIADDRSVKFKGQEIVYKESEQTITSESPVHFQYGSAWIKGKEMIVDIDEETLEIRGDVEAELIEIPGEGNEMEKLDSPVKIFSDLFQWSRANEIVEFSRNAIAKHGPHFLSADKISFSLNNRRKYFFAENNVEVLLMPDEEQQESDNDDVLEYEITEKTQIKSDFLAYHPDSGSFLFLPRVVIVQPNRRFAADRLELFMNAEEGEFLGAVAKGDVRGRMGQDLLFSDSAILNKSEAKILLTENPRLQSENANLKANKIIYLMSEERYRLLGEVRGTFARKDKKENSKESSDESVVSLGFFNSLNQADSIMLQSEYAEHDEDQGITEFRDSVVIKTQDETILTDVMMIEWSDLEQNSIRSAEFPEGIRYTRENYIVSGDEGKYEAEDDRFILAGDAKIWQGNAYTRAEKMVFLLSQEKILCSNSVESYVESDAASAAGNPGGKEGSDEAGSSLPRSTWIKADSSEFDGERNIINFRGNVKVDKGDLALTCEKLTVKIDEESGFLSEISAENNVELKLNEIRAQSDGLRYSERTKIVYLTGETEDKARIWMEDRGSFGKLIELDLINRSYKVKQGKSIFMPPETAAGKKKEQEKTAEEQMPSFDDGKFESDNQPHEKQNPGNKKSHKIL